MGLTLFSLVFLVTGAAALHAQPGRPVLQQQQRRRVTIFASEATIATQANLRMGGARELHNLITYFLSVNTRHDPHDHTIG